MLLGYSSIRASRFFRGLILGVWVPLSVTTTAVAEPTWCRYAKSDTERTICATSELWNFDRCEDGLFRQSKRLADRTSRRRLERSERAFVSARDRCGADVSCIARNYRSRIDALDRFGSSPCAAAIAASQGSPPSSKLSGNVFVKPSPELRCKADAAVKSVSRSVVISSRQSTVVPHGGEIDISWRFDRPGQTKAKLYLIGAMPDGVRFKGIYQYDQNGSLKSGPGFVALPGGSHAPYDIKFGQGDTRVVIPVQDPDVPASGAFKVLPYVAGELAIQWALVGVKPGCRDGEVVLPLKTLGPYKVTPGTPRIVVQDFVPPDLTSAQLAEELGKQRIEEIALSSNGRYRLETLDRRYRVFDRANGAKLVDRAGVKPRFSPVGRFVLASNGDTQKRYPTGFEIIDLYAGRVVDRAFGPIIGWSNGDALLVDARRAYRGVEFSMVLIDRDEREPHSNGYFNNRPNFFMGCGSCDAWTGMNLRVDWNTFFILAGDSHASSVTSIANLTSSRVVDETLSGNSAKAAAYLRLLSVEQVEPLVIGWESSRGLKLTHVGRGDDGYDDDMAGISLQPTQSGRSNQLEAVAQRRIAYNGSKVLLGNALDEVNTDSGAVRSAWNGHIGAIDASSKLGSKAVRSLGRLGLFVEPTQLLPEVPIPQGNSYSNVIRPWPKSLEAEIVSAIPSLAPNFRPTEGDFSAVVGVWRGSTALSDYLIIQHGEAASTSNGGHNLQVELLGISGSLQGIRYRINGLGGGFSQFVGRDHVVGRIYKSDDEHLIVAIPGKGLAAVNNVGPRLHTKLINMVEPTLLCGFSNSRARGIIVQHNCDGQFFIFDPSNSTRPILSGRVADDEVIVYNEQGYYASSYEGAHFVHLGFPGLAGVHSFEQFANTLHRPEIIRAIIAGTQSRFPEPKLKPPPVLRAKLAATLRTSVRLEVSAQSVNSLANIQVLANGKTAKRTLVSGRKMETELTVRRAPHERMLTVVATDSSGYRSRSQTVRFPAIEPRDNTLHVLAIGVDTYDHLKPLGFAAHDAETLVKTLSPERARYYAKVRPLSRTDRSATPAGILAELRSIVANATERDTILFSYAGHGARTQDGAYFLTTPKSDPLRLAQTALDWAKLSRILGSAKARVIVLLDACHSGQTGQIAATNDGAIDVISSRAPMIVLAASKGRQFSEELPATGGGVFTQSLAQLLTRGRTEADLDKSGTLEISEVYRALKQAVAIVTKRRQTPWLVRKNIIGDAPLF